jgi:hypothetical protein
MKASWCLIDVDMDTGTWHGHGYGYFSLGQELLFKYSGHGKYNSFFEKVCNFITKYLKTQAS